jgi:glycosyltransferase involved in cell wall biosynthesis
MPGKVPDVTFVVNRNSSKIYERNFAASPCLEGFPDDRIIIQEGFPSAAAAYNDAIDRASADLLVFAHQDVYFPADWLANLDQSLAYLQCADPNWGVLGGWGVSNRGTRAGYLYSVGLGVLGAPFERPVAIDTLDEYVLIMRKSSGLRFDPSLPHFHFYGTDICLSARTKKKNCYAISAFCIHNTSYGVLPPEFFNCYWDVKRKWREFLPVQTPCIRITRWNEDLIIRRLKHIYFSIFRRDYKLHPRLEDPRSVMQFAAVLSDKG